MILKILYINKFKLIKITNYKKIISVSRNWENREFFIIFNSQVPKNHLKYRYLEYVCISIFFNCFQ